MKYILLMCLLFCARMAHSQAQKIKIKGIMTVIKDPEGEFLYSRAWVETDFLGVMNFDKNKINIYMTSEFDIDIVKIGNSTKDTHNNSILKLTGVDDAGEKCEIVLITLDKAEDGYKFFLKIEYPEIILEYRYIYE